MVTRTCGNCGHAGAVISVPDSVPGQLAPIEIVPCRLSPPVVVAIHQRTPEGAFIVPHSRYPDVGIAQRCSRHRFRAFAHRLFFFWRS